MKNNATFAKILTVVGPSFDSTPTEVTYRKSRHKLVIWQSMAAAFEIRHECLKISPKTVIEALKKDRHLKAVDEAKLAELN